MRKFMLVVAILIMLLSVTLPSVSLAECQHLNTYYDTILYNLGASGHSALTVLKCRDCGETLPAPLPGPTPPMPHNMQYRYVTNGVNSHTCSLVCGCGYVEISFSEDHTYTYVTDYHGTGVHHYIKYKCTKCNQNKTTSYICPGNPCISPLRYIELCAE